MEMFGSAKHTKMEDTKERDVDDYRGEDTVNRTLHSNDKSV